MSDCLSDPTKRAAAAAPDAPPNTPMISADAKYISWLLRQLFFDLHLLLNGLSNKCQIFVVFAIEQKQGWIHGRTVPDSWAGAVMQKSLAIQKCY